MQRSLTKGPITGSILLFALPLMLAYLLSATPLGVIGIWLSVPVGFISAIHGKFCGSCNRVRLTSRGFLKLCLCYENGVDLREVLQNGTAADLRDVMAQAILKKPMEHCFERPKDMTEHHLMSGIGG